MEVIPQKQSIGHSIGLVIVEFGIVAGLFVADVYHHIFSARLRSCSCWDEFGCGCVDCTGRMLGSRGPRVGHRRLGWEFLAEFASKGLSCF